MIIVVVVVVVMAVVVVVVAVVVNGCGCSEQTEVTEINHNHVIYLDHMVMVDFPLLQVLFDFNGSTTTTTIDHTNRNNTTTTATTTTATTTTIVGKPSGEFSFVFFSFSYALLIYFVLATKIISKAQPLQQRWPQCHTPSLANITNLQPISKPIAATATGKFSLLCFISYTNVYFKLIYLLMIVWDKRGLETQCISSPQVFFSSYFIFSTLLMSI